MSSIERNFLQAIKSRKEIYVNEHGQPPPGAFGAPRNVPPLIIAPLNTDIRMINIPKYTLGSAGFRALNATRKPLPTNWNWRHPHSEDSSSIVRKKKLIEPARSQQRCGSCWAISVAGIISDLFVVSGLVDYAPNLSTTYILSTYPQGQCGGGNPSILYGDVKKKGLPSEHCVNYYWCDNSSLCNPEVRERDGGNEFGSGDELLNRQNALIPPSGCFYPDNKKLYYIDNISYSSIGSPNDTDQFRLEAKRHIMEYGPASGCFVVFSNFTSGNFSATKNIYFEDVDYQASSNGMLKRYEPSYDTNEGKMLGGHAIAVIGWGEERNVPLANGTKASVVPYWYCRNSWGPNWGNDKGFYKVAMYPFNKKICFDSSGELQGFGGFIFARASKIMDKKIKNKIPENQLPENVDKSFYQRESSSGNRNKRDEEGKDEEGKDEEDRNEDMSDVLTSFDADKMRFFLIVVSIIIFIVVMIILIVKLIKRRKSFTYNASIYEAVGDMANQRTVLPRV